ncbi:hypothetical protein HNP84_007361 [Thermocatellispora tengchongensis]|uniref:Uncharacterized protein n=1 Tax=Thermocatellispora tengchongensis TaxID=1073253 RepID=A0A840PF48_9ACTN|nr:hypothetical protein [Thermocatellispora tengchongensis]
MHYVNHVHHIVRFGTFCSRELPFLGPAVLLAARQLTYVLVDGGQIDPRALWLLSDIGTRLASEIHLRSACLPPWQRRIRLLLEEVSAEAIAPRWTSRGVDIPFPHHLTTEAVARSLSSHGTARWNEGDFMSAPGIP